MQSSVIACFYTVRFFLLRFYYYDFYGENKRTLSESILVGMIQSLMLIMVKFDITVIPL